MTTSTQELRVALLGLGLMGSGMAKSLLKAGFPLTIYNRTQEKIAPFVAEGARRAATPAEAAAQADVVVSMVADDDASRAVWLGAQGALAGVFPGTVLVEAGTLSLAWIEELAAAAEQQRCPLLDAPVTGSKNQAAAGELLFLVGGADEVLEQVRPVLKAMSRDIVHLGPQGSGCMMKLINNFLCGVQAASLAEAVALIEKTGLDSEKASDVLGSGAPGSPLVQIALARMAARDYDPHFYLAWMAKDMAYACREGEQHQQPLKTGAAALAVLSGGKAHGNGFQDFSAVVEQFRSS